MISTEELLLIMLANQRTIMTALRNESAARDIEKQINATEFVLVQSGYKLDTDLIPLSLKGG